MRIKSLFWWCFALPCCLGALDHLSGIDYIDLLAPDVAIDGSGNLTAVWMESKNGGLKILASTRPLGGAWSAPERISQNYGNVFWPQISSNQRGDTIVIWSEYGPSPPLLMSAWRTAGGAWSGPVAAGINSSGIPPAILSSDENGNAIAIWSKCVPGEVQLASYDAGKNVWSPQMDLDNKVMLSPAFSVSAAGAGCFLIVWNRVIQIDSTIMGWKGVLTGEWGERFSITAPGTIGLAPSCSVNSAGDALVAWQDCSIDAPHTTIRAVCYSAQEDKWSEPVLISCPDNDCCIPQTGLNDQGMGVVAWVKLDEAGQTVQASILPQGGSWRSAEDLSLLVPKVICKDIAINQQGFVLCCWESEINEQSSIYQSVYVPSAAAWEPCAVLSDTNGGKGPAVALNNSNKGVVVWNTDQQNSSIVGADFEPQSGWSAIFVIQD